MTETELILAALLAVQSLAWITVDFRRFSKDFDRWLDDDRRLEHSTLVKENAHG